MREGRAVKPPRHVASCLVKALVFLGVIVLLAGLFALGGAMSFAGPNGPAVAEVVVAVSLLAAGSGLIGAAVALDRRDCRREDRDAVPGFDVVVRRAKDGAER